MGEKCVNQDGPGKCGGNKTLETEKPAPLNWREGLVMCAKSGVGAPLVNDRWNSDNPENVPVRYQPCPNGNGGKPSNRCLAEA